LHWIDKRTKIKFLIFIGENAGIGPRLYNLILTRKISIIIFTNKLKKLKKKKKKKKKKRKKEREIRMTGRPFDSLMCGHGMTT
jgi:GTP-binding protein EngB required for normal cell division